MKSILTKVPAIMGMIVTLISLGLLLATAFVAATEEPVDFGINKSFGLWIFSMIVALFSLLLYVIDAILSVIKAFMRIHPRFNAVLAILLIAAIPMAILLGGSPGIGNLIWNIYYVGIFILEIVSIVKHVKMELHQKATR